jgi:hypothetical protein
VQPDRVDRDRRHPLPHCGEAGAKPQTRPPPETIAATLCLVSALFCLANSYA